MLVVAVEIAFGIGVVYASAIEILDFILFLSAIVYLVKDAVADEGRIEAAAAGDVESGVGLAVGSDAAAKEIACRNVPGW